MNYKSMLFLVLMLSGNMIVLGQSLQSPSLAVKTNLLSAPFGSINAAVELLVYKPYTNSGKVMTLNFPVSYNPFTFSNNKKLKHIAIQPELRVWNSRPFEGFFVGLHAHYAYYNVGGIDLPLNIAPSLKEKRYQGQLFGAGLSAGYYFKLNDRFKLETSVGAGYAYMDHDVYRCVTCGTKLDHETKNYLGPTKAVLALVYLIK